MPTQHYMREASQAAADTWYKLTGDGAGGTLNDIIIPQGIGRIYNVKASVGIGATAAVATVLVRFQGTAVPHGTETIPVAGISGAGTGVTMASENISLNLDLPLQPGILEIWGCFSGGDSGTPELQVSVDCDEKRGSAWYLVREGQTATADVWATLAGTGTGDTNTDPVVPQGASALVGVLHAVGQGATSAVCTYGCRMISVSGSIPGGDQHYAGLSAIAGSGTVTDIQIVRPMETHCQVPVKSGAQVRVQAVMSGADAGTPEQAVGLVFA